MKNQRSHWKNWKSASRRGLRNRHNGKAESGLIEIERFVSRDDPMAAIKLCRDLLAEIRSLREFPNRGSLLDRRRPAVRKLVHGPYLIIYQVANDELIEVLRVWHAAQDRGGLRLSESAAIYAAAG